MKDKLQNDVVKEIARIVDPTERDPQEYSMERVYALVQCGRTFGWHKGVRQKNMAQLQEFLVALRGIK